MNKIKTFAVIKFKLKDSSKLLPENFAMPWFEDMPKNPSDNLVVRVLGSMNSLVSHLRDGDKNWELYYDTCQNVYKNINEYEFEIENKSVDAKSFADYTAKMLIKNNEKYLKNKE